MQAAIRELAKDEGDYVFLSEVRAKLPDVDRGQLDRALLEMHEGRVVGMDPYPGRHALTPDDRAAGLRLGAEDMHLIYLPADLQRRNMSSQQRAPDDLDAKRQRLAELEEAGRTSKITRESLRFRDRAAELRREIEDDSTAGKVDQPREQTRADILRVYGELARQPNDLVSLAVLRGNLPHLRHGELTAVLKEMDRERLIHLDPDSNRKALPPEAHEAAVVIGGEPKHFISSRGGGGKA